MDIFRGNWADAGDMMRDFEIIPPQCADCKILLAAYDYVDYNGQAFVLLLHKEKNTLYEVNGSHCSCFGLEGQWEPEETSIAALRYRVVEGTLGQCGNLSFDNDLLVLLDALETVLDEDGNTNESTDHLVVVRHIPRLGYFVVEDEESVNFSPSYLPNVYRDTCRVYEHATLRKWVLEDMSFEEENTLSISKTYKPNPEIALWHEEGEDHISSETGRSNFGDDPPQTTTWVSVSRTRTIDCYRVRVDTVGELAKWLKDNNGYIVDGSTHDILEDKIIKAI